MQELPELLAGKAHRRAIEKLPLDEEKVIHFHDKLQLHELLKVACSSEEGTIVGAPLVLVNLAELEDDVALLGTPLIHRTVVGPILLPLHLKKKRKHYEINTHSRPHPDLTAGVKAKTQDDKG